MAETEFREIFNPTRLDAIHRILFPWPINEPLDGAKLFSEVFGANSRDYQSEIYDICFEQALKPLSLHSLDEMADLIKYLPQPEEPVFPERALGMLLLLDQVPRMILSGVDGRWTNAFFDVLAKQLVKQLRALPLELRPDNLARWETRGYTYENAIYRVRMFAVPLTHSESLDDHKLQLAESEAVRVNVEKHYGVTDPHRSKDAQDQEEVLLFWRLVTDAQAYRTGDKFQDFILFMCRVSRAHEPVIRAYGRYPYRNATLGRTSTKDEEEYLEQTNHFAEPKKDVAERIAKDIKAGRWTPLQGRQAS